MSSESEHRSVAEALITIPRYLSQDKIRVLGIDGVASAVTRVATDPDNYTQKLVDEPGGLKCPVCGKTKHAIYFGGNQPPAVSAPRVCRYCRWRIKTRADEKYRSIKGEPAKPKVASASEAGTLQPEEVEALDQFIRDKGHRSPGTFVSRLRRSFKSRLPLPLPGDALRAAGVYGPNHGGIDAGWYSTTEEEPYGSERREILSWWTATHDAIVEWHLRSYGIFAVAAARSIELEIMRRRGIKERLARRFDYFVLDRVRTQTHLWNIYATDFRARYRQTHVCRACGKTEPLVDLDSDLVLSTNGRILPLCNLHWKTYRRAASESAVLNVAEDPGHADLDAVLGKHGCPVCKCEHSWMDKTYTYTKRFYGIPRRHREICFQCLDVALNRQSRPRPSSKDLEGLLAISRVVGDLPLEDPFKVITQQARTLESAAEIVRLMKKMVRFDTMKRVYGSWFAVLARSGCLPEGSRREVFGTRILAKDGHECLSMAEMQIDDELTRLHIPHRKEVPYPNASFRCDWVVTRGDGLVFIEYFGLSGQASYDEKILKKRAVLAQAGVELIELYYEDLSRLDARLGDLAAFQSATTSSS